MPFRATQTITNFSGLANIWMVRKLYSPNYILLVIGEYNSDKRKWKFIFMFYPRDDVDPDSDNRIVTMYYARPFKTALQKGIQEIRTKLTNKLKY